jgi:photosystem II stability/assembly factor-like uncharacterized protein
MAEGRVFIGKRVCGAAFFIGPHLAITARHVIEDALDSDGNPQQGFEVTLQTRDGSPYVAMVEACDAVLDVASLRVEEPSTEWLRVGMPTQGAAWQVTTRVLDTDPAIGGTIVDPARPIRNEAGHETTLIQLHVKESLGSYEGYSGSPVCVRTSAPGSPRTPVAVGVLVEQSLWRQKEPWQTQPNVANVLWAAPFPAVFDALGLTTDVRPYGDWTLMSPEWAFFRAVRVDPLDPSTVYAGLGIGQGMYRSRDGGRYWEAMNTGLGTRTVRSIAASTFDARLYAATDAGLWISHDRGMTWREDPEFQGKSLLSVALFPQNQELLIVGCQRPGGGSMSSVGVAHVRGSGPVVHEGLQGSGLKFSRDGGKTWATLPTPDNPNGLWIDPEDSRVLALASAEDGVFFSRDGVEQLRPVETFPEGQKPVYVVLLSADPDRLLVGTLHGGLYWSDDDGVSWERGAGIPDMQVSDIAFLAGAPSKIAVATPSGPFESDDGGRRWHRSAKGLDYKPSMVLAPLADGSVILGTDGGGAYRRATGQSAWNPSNRGFPPAIALRLEQAGGWLLAATVGLLRSPDGGESWRYSFASGQVLALAVAPEWAKENPPSSMAKGGLFVSQAGFGSRPAVLMDNPPIEVLIGTARGKLFRSRDSGATWEPLTPPETRYKRSIRSITLSSGTPRRIGVLLKYEGFFVSDNDGKNWSAEPSDALGKAINLIVSSRHNDRRLFAMTVDRGVFLSGDGGTTWANCEGFRSDEIILAIAEPDDDTEVVFAASLVRNVYRSADGGRTFSRIGSIDLPADTDASVLRWTTLVVRPRHDIPATLILGSSLGAYISRDEGKSWESLPAGILKNNYRVNDLLLTAHGTRILMATDKGIFSQELLP